MSSTNLTATAIESNNAGDGGDNVGELSFVQGDVISIISDEGNGTYLCECNGRVGYVFEYLLDFGNGETIHYDHYEYQDVRPNAPVDDENDSQASHVFGGGGHGAVPSYSDSDDLLAQMMREVKMASTPKGRKNNACERETNPSESIVDGQPVKPFDELSRAELNKLSPQAKVGSKQDGTDAAHLLSVDLFQHVLKHIPGPGVTDAARQAALAEVLQSPENLRMKTVHGNRSTDVKLDNEIIDCFGNATALNGDAADRAARQYRFASENANDAQMAAFLRRFGSMKVDTGAPGPKPSLASFASRSAPTQVDGRSSAVQSGAVRFNQDGSVDRRCSAVRNEQLLFTKSGDVDHRSAAVRNESVIVKNHTSASASSPSSTSTASANVPQSPNMTYVQGYTRSDDVQVSGYYRSSPSHVSTSSSPSHASPSGSVAVSGYTRSNGTYVQGYTRAAPSPSAGSASSRSSGSSSSSRSSGGGRSSGRKCILCQVKQCEV